VRGADAPAGLAIQAMRRGKDVMVDKPGVTTADHSRQLSLLCTKLASSGPLGWVA